MPKKDKIAMISGALLLVGSAMVIIGFYDELNFILILGALVLISYLFHE